MKLEQLGGIVVSFVLLLVGSTAAQVRSAGARSAIHNTIEESNNEQQQQIRQQQLRAAAAASSNTNSQPSTTPVDNSGAPPLAAITTTTKATTTRTTEETRRLQPQTLTPWERETNSRKERYTWTKVRSAGARSASWTELADSCLEKHTSKECVVVGDSMTCPIGSTLNFQGWNLNRERRQIIADLACPLDAIAQSSFAEAASEEDGPCVCSVKLAKGICELINYYDDWGCSCRKCPPGSLLNYAYDCTIRLTQGCRALDCNAECTDVVPPEELGVQGAIWVPAEIPTPAPMPPTPRPTRPPYFWDIPQRTEAPEIEVTAPTESPETGSPTSSRSAPSTSEPNPEQEQNPTPCPATLGIGNLRCIGSSIERGRTVSRGNSILV